MPAAMLQSSETPVACGLVTDLPVGCGNSVTKANVVSAEYPNRRTAASEYRARVTRPAVSWIAGSPRDRTSRGAIRSAGHLGEHA